MYSNSLTHYRYFYSDILGHIYEEKPLPFEIAARNTTQRDTILKVE